MVAVRFLLDSNVVSEPTRPRPDPKLTARLDRHQHASAIPAPAWHELWFGARRLPNSKKRRQIEHFLRGVQSYLPILPYDQAAADHHAAERARLAAKGLTPPFIDGQIAAVAFVHRLVLVTSNLRDFQHFEGIEIEDWRS